ncbi:MAG: MFS transporter [Alphaproteobacteria bacterium]|nr:MFS transporter [Alphaproteobacteria bacterium]
MTEQPRATSALLRDRNFLHFILSRTANGMGIHILTVAVGWHVYELTKDPLDLGYIGLAQFAPHFVFFLAAGMAADRLDRRMILAICNIVHLIAVALLMVVLWRDIGGVPAILAILVVHGTARAFFHTASQAILPNLVSAPMFPKAVAYSSSANKVAQLVGPSLGGALVAWAGDWAYYTTVIMFAIAGVGSVMIRGALHVRSAEPMGLATLLGGFNYVWSNKVVLGAVSIDLVAVLCGGVMGLLPIYAADILHVGADGLGVMRAMPGVGSLIMGLALARLAAPRSMGPALFIALGVFGASIIVFSLSELFWLSLAALVIYGASDMVSVYIRLTLVQTATPDSMRGRVSAVNSVSINASNELGDFRAGLSAAAVGVVPAVLFGGIATLVVTLLWARFFPAMRRVDRLEDVARD